MLTFILSSSLLRHWKKKKNGLKTFLPCATELYSSPCSKESITLKWMPSSPKHTPHVLLLVSEPPFQTHVPLYLRWNFHSRKNFLTSLALQRTFQMCAFFSAWSIAILGVSLGNSFLTDAELVDLSNVQHIQFIWRFFHDAERPNPVLLLCVNWIYGVCWVYKFEIEAYKVCSHSLAFVRLLNSFYWHSISLLVNH